MRRRGETNDPLGEGQKQVEPSPPTTVSVQTAVGVRHMERQAIEEQSHEPP